MPFHTPPVILRPSGFSLRNQAGLSPSAYNSHLLPQISDNFTYQCPVVPNPGCIALALARSLLEGRTTPTRLDACHADCETRKSTRMNRRTRWRGLLTKWFYRIFFFRLPLLTYPTFPHPTMPSLALRYFFRSFLIIWQVCWYFSDRQQVLLSISPGTLRYRQRLSARWHIRQARRARPSWRRLHRFSAKSGPWLHRRRLQRRRLSLA